MRVADICTRSIVHVLPEISVRKAAEVMRHRHVGALVVVERPDGESTPIGVLTDRDIVLEVVAMGVDPDAVTAADVMTRTPATCAEDEELFDAIQAMRRHGVRRLPVVDSRGFLVGMLAADDVIAVLGEHLGNLSHGLVHEQALEIGRRP